MQLIQELNKLIHSEHPLIVLFQDILGLLSSIWNYVIFTVDNQSIAVSNLLIGICLLGIGLRYAKNFSRFVRQKISSKEDMDTHTVCSLERISYYSFIVILLLVILEICNIPLTTLTVMGTTLALGLGLGSQNVINNFISGLIIMVEKPIKLGDTVEVKNVIGKVVHIGARCVTLQSENNINMLIPNSKVLEQNIINWTLNDPTLKLSLTLSVGSEHPLSKIDELLCKALDQNESILKTPPPQILLNAMTQNAHVLEVEFWINLENELGQKRIINTLNRAIHALFSTHHINIADN